ncbi:hypothetical protein MTO96_039195 [Rhipicephalus appendiculatus]
MLATPETPPHEPVHETPKKNDTLLGNELLLAEEQLGAVSLGTSTPLQLSPSVPTFGASFTVCTANAAGLEPSSSKGLSPCTLPGPANIQRKVASPNEFFPELFLSAPEDMPSSPCLLTLDKSLELLWCWERFDRDGNLNSTPPGPLPALGESFVITRQSPTGNIVALNGSPIPGAAFAIPDILPAETMVTQASSTKMDATMVRVGSLEQPSSKSAALAFRTVACTPPEPLAALGESFVVDAESQAADTVASNGLAVAETHVSPYDCSDGQRMLLNVQAPLAKMDATMTREVPSHQPSSKMAAPASRNAPCTPPESLPAIGESFVVATESLDADTAASDGSPVAVAETTFAIPDIVDSAAKQAPSIKVDATTVRKAGGLLLQPSSKSAALAGRTVPLQRPAARLSVATKSRAVRPSSATRGAADTTFATSVRPPSRQSVASKAAELPKAGSAAAASQPARKGVAPSALAAPRQPPVQATPAVPEPRRALVPPCRSQHCFEEKPPASEGGIWRNCTGPCVQALHCSREGGAQRTFLHGARRSVAALPKATTAASQPVPAEPPKAKTGPQAASAAQPSLLATRSRLRPPSSRASGSTSRVPRPATFREASCLPQVPESPVAGVRLSSTPARPDVPRSGSTPTLTPIRKQPDWR